MHWCCLFRQAFHHIVAHGANGSYFLDQVFFHPNVNVGGWVTLRTYYENIRGGRPCLPPFPLAPRFWSLPVPEPCLHPPASFFDEWIRRVARGGELSLDPSLFPRSTSRA